MKRFVVNEVRVQEAKARGGEAGLIQTQVRGRLLRTGHKDKEQRDADGDLVSSLINGHSDHDWEITT